MEYLLFYSSFVPIQKIITNFTNTFNVYLRMAKGTGKIALGNIIASVSGQSMGAKEAWDGKINLSDSMKPVSVVQPFDYRKYREEMDIARMSETKQTMSAVIGKQAVGGFAAFIETGGSK